MSVLDEQLGAIGFRPNYPLGVPSDPTEVTLLYEAEGLELVSRYPRLDREGYSDTDLRDIGIDLYIQFDLLDGRNDVYLTVGGPVLRWADENGHHDVVAQARTWDRGLEASARAIGELVALMLNAHRAGFPA
jgi:hypothetical protein